MKNPLTNLNNLARRLCVLEGGTVDLPIAQVKDVLAALATVLREQHSVAAAFEIVAALVARGGRRGR